MLKATEGATISKQAHENGSHIGNGEHVTFAKPPSSSSSASMPLRRVQSSDNMDNVRRVYSVNQPRAPDHNQRDQG